MEKPGIMRLKWLRSLKLRILLILVLVGMIPCIVMRYGIITNYKEYAVDVRTRDVQNQMIILANHLVNNNYLEDPSSEVVNAEIEQLAGLYDGRVLVIDDNFKIIKDTYGISQGKYSISQEVIKCFLGETINHYDDAHLYIEMVIPIVSMQENDEGESNGNVNGVILASVSALSIDSQVKNLKRNAAITEILIMILIMGIAFTIPDILLKPFNRVSDAISQVKAGFTDEKIAVSDYLETEHIVDAFNQLLERMKVLDDSRQEFVSNVSHELKTPLTSMKVLADSLNMQENVPIELYQEFMQDITQEIDRENKIINDLLSLVKMDKTAADLNIDNIDMNKLLELLFKRLKPIAAEKQIELIMESRRQVTAGCDEVKLTLALSNLIENAIKYNKDGGWVKVILDADHQFFTIEISDSGIGIPQDAQSHIYERFYRVDKSHSREIGGTGLGLSITRNVVLMHRGSIKVKSEEGVGTIFTVKIPLNYIM